MAKQKLRLMFNASNGALLGHLPPGQTSGGLDPDQVKIKTVEMDIENEIYLGTYEAGEVKRIDELEKDAPRYIDEELLNDEIRVRIEEKYPLHKQLNIMIDMLNKSDIPNTPEFTEMMGYLEDLRAMNKERKDVYKSDPTTYALQTKEQAKLSVKQRMAVE